MRILALPVVLSSCTPRLPDWPNIRLGVLDMGGTNPSRVWSAMAAGAGARDRPGRAWVATSIAAVAGLALSGCVPGRPVVPNTEIVVRLPVVDKLVTVRDIAENNPDYLEITGHGRLALNFTSEFGRGRREEIGDRLRISPRAGEFVTPIGDLHIAGREIPATSVGMNDLLGVEATPGTVAAIPSLGIDHLIEVPLEGVDFLEVMRGHLEVSVHNGLPLTLEGLRLALVDLGEGGSVVDTVGLGDLPAGTAAGGRFTLDGKDISGRLGMVVSGRTAAAPDVPLEGNPSLYISGDVSEILASRITGLIPRQVVVAHQSLPVPDDRVQTDTATVHTGEVLLQVRNELPVAIEMNLGLDDFTRPDHSLQVFTIDRVAPGGRDEARFDLSGNEFTPRDPLAVRLFYQVTTLPSDGVVTLRSSDVIEVDGVAERSIVLSRFQGRLNRVAVPFEAVEKEMEFPRGLDSIVLRSSEITVFLTSAIGFGGQVTLDVEGVNNSGHRASYRVAQTFERGDPHFPVTAVVATESEGFTDFLNLLPRFLTVTPSFLIGHGAETESIESDHWVQLDSVVFQSGSRFRIKADTRVEPDAVKRRIDSDAVRQDIRARVESARVRTHIENHTALGVRVSLWIARRRQEVYVSPNLVLPQEGAFSVRPAAIDDRGQVVGSVVSEKEIELSRGEIEIFLEEEGVYTGALVEFEATAGEVELSAGDHVVIRSAVEILVALGDE